MSVKSRLGNRETLGNVQLFGGGDLAEWLTGVLTEPARRFMRRAGVDEDGWRGAALTEPEACALRSALESGHIKLDVEAGTLTGHFDVARPYLLFAPYDGGLARPGRAWSWSWRESLTQLAFAAELVDEHEWRPGEVALELAHNDVGAGPHPRRRPAVVAEVKLRDTGPRSLDTMLAVFRELAGGPPTTVSKGDRDNAATKYAELVLLRPPVYCAVAPGIRRTFCVSYLGEAAFLTSTDLTALRPRS